MKFKRRNEADVTRVMWKTWGEVCDYLGGIIGPFNPARQTDKASDTCGEKGPFIEFTVKMANGEDYIVRHGDYIVRENGELNFYRPYQFNELFVISDNEE